ncbi:MAG: polysaccharide biosynthesis/export family protein [Planctomycetaceae bacterium]
MIQPPPDLLFDTRSRAATVSARLPILALLFAATGCTSFLGSYNVTGVPVSRVPRVVLSQPRKDDFEDISMLRLRQSPPDFYALGPGDVLGFYARNLFERQDDLPPVHYSEDGNLPPAVGVPVPVREDGTLSLPYLKPINVEGLSLVQATELIRDAYTGADGESILKEDSEVSLTMIRRRTVRVLVIREESGGLADVTKRGTGNVIDLPAYENDVLHALSETGGMPGLDAKNEVLIYRGLFEEGLRYDDLIQGDPSANCNCLGECFCDESPRPDPPGVTRIPLRYHPATPPVFGEEDILLNDGDILIIRSRDRETFFTAGLLGGGEHLLPRDKDLDVIGAIAIAGGPLGNIGTGVGAIGGQRGSGGGRSNGGYCQPSEVIIIRELPCGNQITMKIDLNRALQNPSERILIQPNDVVMLRYTPTHSRTPGRLPTDSTERRRHAEVHPRRGNRKCCTEPDPVQFPV